MTERDERLPDEKLPSTADGHSQMAQLVLLLSHIRGVGPTSAALVVGMIAIERSPTVSSLWRYAGFGVAPDTCRTCTARTDGDTQTPVPCPECLGSGMSAQRERARSGRPRTYNARLKSMVWRLVDLQVKTRGPYRIVYDRAKARYLSERPHWSRGRCELAARRVAAKLFLSHLWHAWRQEVGLPVHPPWIGRHSTDQALSDPWLFVSASVTHRRAAEADAELDGEAG